MVRENNGIIFLGGTGYLGSKILTNLVRLRYNILCVIRRGSEGKVLPDIKEKINICYFDEFPQNMETSSITYGILINAMCCYQLPNFKTAEIMDANFYVPLNVMELCEKNGLEQVYNIGTSLPRMLNTYSFSKNLFSEWGKFCVEKNDNLSFINLQLESFYGENQSSIHFIMSMIDKMSRDETIKLTEGNQLRDFIYINDVVDIIVSLIDEKQIKGYVDIPIGTGVGVTIKEVVEFIKVELDSKSELQFGAIPKRKNEPSSAADISYLTNLGLLPKTNWKDGIRILLNKGGYSSEINK